MAPRHERLTSPDSGRRVIRLRLVGALGHDATGVAMPNRKRIDKYGEDYQRPKIIDTSDALLLLPALQLVLGCIALVYFFGSP